MARIPRIGKGWDPVTTVFVILAFVGSFVYLVSCVISSLTVVSGGGMLCHVLDDGGSAGS